MDRVQAEHCWVGLGSSSYSLATILLGQSELGRAEEALQCCVAASYQLLQLAPDTYHTKVCSRLGVLADLAARQGNHLAGLGWLARAAAVTAARDSPDRERLAALGKKWIQAKCAWQRAAPEEAKQAEEAGAASLVRLAAAGDGTADLAPAEPWVQVRLGRVECCWYRLAHNQPDCDMSLARSIAGAALLKISRAGPDKAMVLLE